MKCIIFETENIFNICTARPMVSCNYNLKDLHVCMCVHEFMNFLTVLTNQVAAFYCGAGCCMDCAWNIFSDKVSGRLSPRCRSLFDSQHCEYCWLYQVPQRYGSVIDLTWSLYISIHSIVLSVVYH